MKSKSVETITSNDEYVRMRIFDGELPFKNCYIVMRFANPLRMFAFRPDAESFMEYIRNQNGDNIPKINERGDVVYEVNYSILEREIELFHPSWLPKKKTFNVIDKPPEVGYE